jgi:hypothetical protein
MHHRTATAQRVQGEGKDAGVRDQKPSMMAAEQTADGRRALPSLAVIRGSLPVDLQIAMPLTLVGIVARSHRTNPWGVSAFIDRLCRRLSMRSTPSATRALLRLEGSVGLLEETADRLCRTQLHGLDDIV